MLRITISRNGPGAVDYFTQALSKEDYFFTEEKVSAIWQGKTAALLGLKGEVTKETFSALVNNIHPLTGKQLTVRNADNRRSGVEFCFNSPKSASIILALTKDQAILEAHRNAVNLAMGEIQESMQTQANQFGRKFYDTTGNIIYASFEHHTSRPVEINLDDKKIYAPDCHLHSHVYVPSCTWVESKQRFQAIETGTIHTLSPYYEALYHSAFSKALEDMGYNIVRTADRWEIDISREIIEKFSNRTQIIEEIAKEKGITDAKEKATIGARSRLKKNKSVPEQSLYSLWEQRLTQQELQAIRSAKGSAKDETDTINAKDAVNRALEHFLERESAVPEKRVLGKAMSYGYGVLSSEDVKKELKTRSNILSTERQTIKYITTKEAVILEDKMIEFAATTKNTVPALNPNYQVEQEFLSEEQRNAIQHILKSNNQVTILMGGAGTGKTSLLNEVKTGIEQGGKKLVGFAPSAEASRGVLREKGFEDSDTIAALLNNLKIQQSLKDNVILIDEAGMVGTGDMASIFDLARQWNARVILSGDSKQHNSIAKGDALRQLSEKSGLPVATVNTIVRQNKNETYRQAIQALADGDTLKGFNKLDKMNAVIEIEDARQRQEELAKAYLNSIDKGRSALVVSPTHVEGRAITSEIRNKMKTSGKITGPERVFKTQNNLSFTEAQKKDVAVYDKGQLIQFHQNVKGGFKAGDKFHIEDKTKDGKVIIKSLNVDKQIVLPLEESKNYQVYQSSQTSIAKGDLIKVTCNGKSVENTKIHNGQTYTVKGFTKEGHIRLSNGKTLDKDFSNWGHGFVSTSHSSQGKDAKDIYIAQSSTSYAASNQKQFYVSSSRGTEKIQIFCDDKAELKKAIIRNTDRISAKEVADEHYQRQTRLNRRNHYEQEIKRDYNYERTNGRQPQIEIPKTQRSIDRE